MSIPNETDEHRMFRATARSFVEKELTPFAEEWEAAHWFPDSVFKRVGEMGFLGLRVPEELGGMENYA